VLRHRVTVLTLCPLGEPEIAIGQEPRIEPWLPRIESLAKFQESTGVVTTEKMKPKDGRASQSKTLERSSGISANSGLDIETKNLSATGRRRSFFVDIPFYRTTYLRLR
jgi:hypothetical protein